MGSILNKITDDVLGLDPNGGGIYDVPIVGDIIDDQLGLDPGQSPLQHLLEIAGWATLGTVAAGAAGVGPAAGPIEALKNGASITDILPNWTGLSTAEQATVAEGLAAESGGAFTAANVAQSAASAAPLVDVVASSGQPVQTAEQGGFWNTLGNIASGIGNVAGAVGNVAGAVGAGAELYDALTGEGAKRDREHARRTVADIAPLTDLQQRGIQSGVDAASDPRIAQGVDTLYGAQQQGSTALGTGLDTLSGIATGSDPYTQRLAGQAASAAHLGASRQGALGSARSQRAAQTAAADVIAKRQQSAAGTLASQGQSLLGQGASAYNLAQAPGTTYRNLGGLQQQQRQAELNQQAQVAAAAAREPTTAETVGRIAGGLEALPTVYDQGRQGVQSLYNLFRS